MAVSPCASDQLERLIVASDAFMVPLFGGASLRLRKQGADLELIDADNQAWSLQPNAAMDTLGDFEVEGEWLSQGFVGRHLLRWRNLDVALPSEAQLRLTQEFSTDLNKGAPNGVSMLLPYHTAAAKREAYLRELAGTLWGGVRFLWRKEVIDHVIRRHVILEITDTHGAGVHFGRIAPQGENICVVLAGHTLPVGAHVQLRYGSANRTPKPHIPLAEVMGTSPHPLPPDQRLFWTPPPHHWSRAPQWRTSSGESLAY